MVKQICDKFIKILCPIYLKSLSAYEWHKIANEFDKQWNFSNALGAVDEKHVVIQKPKNGSSY